MSITEANKIIKKYVKLRERLKLEPTNKRLKADFKTYEQQCLHKFKYLVLMKASKYKHFNNYEDLLQEGMEALTKALSTYEPTKGNCFWWLHKYIDTRIARCANLHTAIRFPLQYTKTVKPYRVSHMPALIDQGADPYDILERKEELSDINSNLSDLTSPQKQIVNMLFGMDGGKPQSIAKVCKNLNMTRPICLKMIEQAVSILKKEPTR